MTAKHKVAKKSTKTANSSKSARKPKSAAPRSARAAMAVATSRRSTDKERAAAMAEVPLAVCESDKDLQAVLSVLRNTDEPVEVRLAALQSLAAAAFSVVAFESCRADYIGTLREVAGDADPEIRQRVLGLLAREKDGYAQKRLLEGLQNPKRALVPPEKALQLLSYDVHADAYAAARAIVSKPPNADAKREALRLLAADATASPMFEKILRDKGELPEDRQIAASALHAIKPEKLQAHAREILLDPSEHDEIQATSLTALTQFGDGEAIAEDKALLKGVERLSGQGSTKVKKSANQFLGRYRR